MPDNIIDAQIDEIFEIIKENYYIFLKRENKDICKQNTKSAKNKYSFVLRIFQGFYQNHSLWYFLFLAIAFLLFVVFVAFLTLSLSNNVTLDNEPSSIAKIIIIICLVLSSVFTFIAYAKLFAEISKDTYPHQLLVVKDKIKTLNLPKNLNFFKLHDQILSKSLYEVRLISLQACISYFELSISTMEEYQKAYEKISFIITLIFILSIYMIYGNLLEIKKIVDVIKYYPLFVLINSILQGLVYWRCHVRIQCLQQSLLLLNNLKSINIFLKQ